MLNIQYLYLCSRDYWVYFLLLIIPTRTHFSTLHHQHNSYFKYRFLKFPIDHLTWNLPEFFHWRLLFLSSGQMARVIDWEKHNVPICWKPSHEKWTVKVLISNFYNLCGSNPRWRHWQDDQESPDSPQNHGRAGQAPSFGSIFLAAVLRMSLWSIVPWKQQKNTNVWKSGYKTAIKKADRATSVFPFCNQPTHNSSSFFSLENLCY